MQDIAARNRAIKKTLEKAFGRGNVRVRGSRGTGYGWVHVKIAYAPLDCDVRADLEKKCYDLFRAAKIDIGWTYSDDTCQSKMAQCSISFEPCRYLRTMRHDDGALWGQKTANGWEPGEWEQIAA